MKELTQKVVDWTGDFFKTVGKTDAVLGSSRDLRRGIR